jgi:hypothetical protein
VTTASGGSRAHGEPDVDSGLLSTRFCASSAEVPRAVNEGENLNLGWCHLVKQAIPLNEELPDVGLIEFGNQATALAIDVERGSCLERLNQQALSGGTRILCNVCDGVIEHLAGLFSPDYAPSPRSHF